MQTKAWQNRWESRKNIVESIFSHLLPIGNSENNQNNITIAFADCFHYIFALIYISITSVFETLKNICLFWEFTIYTTFNKIGFFDQKDNPYIDNKINPANILITIAASGTLAFAIYAHLSWSWVIVSSIFSLLAASYIVAAVLSFICTVFLTIIHLVANINKFLENNIFFGSLHNNKEIKFPERKDHLCVISGLAFYIVYTLGSILAGAFLVISFVMSSVLELMYKLLGEANDFILGVGDATKFIFNYLGDESGQSNIEIKQGFYLFGVLCGLVVDILLLPIVAIVAIYKGISTDENNTSKAPSYFVNILMIGSLGFLFYSTITSYFLLGFAAICTIQQVIAYKNNEHQRNLWLFLAKVTTTVFFAYSLNSIFHIPTIAITSLSLIFLAIITTSTVGIDNLASFFEFFSEIKKSSALFLNKTGFYSFWELDEYSGVSLDSYLFSAFGIITAAAIQIIALPLCILKNAWNGHSSLFGDDESKLKYSNIAIISALSIGVSAYSIYINAYLGALTLIPLLALIVVYKVKGENGIFAEEKSFINFLYFLSTLAAGYGVYYTAIGLVNFNLAITIAAAFSFFILTSTVGFKNFLEFFKFIPNAIYKLFKIIVVNTFTCLEEGPTKDNKFQGLISTYAAIFAFEYLYVIKNLGFAVGFNPICIIAATSLVCPLLLMLRENLNHENLNHENYKITLNTLILFGAIAIAYCMAQQFAIINAWGLGDTLIIFAPACLIIALNFLGIGNLKECCSQALDGFTKAFKFEKDFQYNLASVLGALVGAIFGILFIIVSAVVRFIFKKIIGTLKDFSYSFFYITGKLGIYDYTIQ